MASSIINRFGPEKMQMLFDDIMEIFQVWETPKEATDEKDTDDLEFQRLQLIKTAYSLSKIAEHFGATLVKLNKKAPSFWRRCDEVIAEGEYEETQTQIQRSSGQAKRF